MPSLRSQQQNITVACRCRPHTTSAPIRPRQLNVPADNTAGQKHCEENAARDVVYSDGCAGLRGLFASHARMLRRLGTRPPSSAEDGVLVYRRATNPRPSIRRRRHTRQHMPHKQVWMITFRTGVNYLSTAVDTIVLGERVGTKYVVGTHVHVRRSR